MLLPYRIREIKNYETATGPEDLVFFDGALLKRISEAHYVENIEGILEASTYVKKVKDLGFEPQVSCYYGDDYLDFEIYYDRPYTKEEEQEKREDLWKELLKFRKDTQDSDLELYKKLHKRFGSKSVDDLM